MISQASPVLTPVSTEKLGSVVLDDGSSRIHASCLPLGRMGLRAAAIIELEEFTMP